MKQKRIFGYCLLAAILCLFSCKDINGTTHSFTGNTIPEEVLELIRSLEDDTPILICGIQVKTRTDTLLSLPPLLLTIH